MAAEQLRLAELLASLSLVTDLGFSLPAEEAMRSCIISTALARKLNLQEDKVSDVFYTALLEHVGCTGFAHESALAYGDEMVLNSAAAKTNDADPKDAFATFIPEVTRGRNPVERIRIITFTLVQGSRFGSRFVTATCEVGSETARRLGLSDGVRRGLREVFELWNGKGAPRRLKGEDISIVGRIARAGATAALFDHIGGEDAAVQALTRRSEGMFDPAVVNAFVANSSEILGETNAGEPRVTVLEVEPQPVVAVPQSRLPEVAAAFADIADLKSPFTLGHSSEVGRLAREAGEKVRLDPESVDRLYIAALLHDLGRVGISNSIWERSGPLSAAQWEQVRLHAYHSERILARSEQLEPMAATAGMHHERLDGSGYHRGSKGREITMSMRILAASDTYQAMTQVRPHREAFSPEEAARRLRDEVGAGRLDGDAVQAVLEAAGRVRSERVRRSKPAGLSDREIEVLRLLARGHSNRDIARRLYISPRTAEHHVQHIYAKIGASSRAAAALFGMEHDLLD